MTDSSDSRATAPVPAADARGAVLALVGAALAAVRTVPADITNAADLAEWADAWAQSHVITNPQQPLDIDAGVVELLRRFPLSDLLTQRLEARWAKLLDRRALRLRVLNGPSAPHVAEVLRDDTMVQARSVWAERTLRGKPIAWKWPIDVAFASVADGVALRSDIAQISTQPWLKPLVSIAAVDRAMEADMLLLRGPAASVLRATSSAKSRPSTGLVVWMTNAPASSDVVTETLAQLGERFPVSAVAFVPVSPSLAADWFVALVRELSHNEPLDVALTLANRRVSAEGAQLLAPPGFMEHAQLSRSIDRLEKKLTSRAAPLPMSIPRGGRAESMLGRSGAVSTHDAGEMLRRAPRDTGFASERGLATVAVELDAAAPHTPTSRYLQAKLVAPGVNGGTRTAWIAGETNTVSVRVGPLDVQWPIAEGQRPFPVEEVLGDEEETDVEVLCYVTGALKRALRRKMTVRRIGASTVVRFPIPLPANFAAPRLTARIVVMHGNRIAQSGRLDGAVSREPSDAVAPATFELDAVIRTNLGGFRTRQSFDACLLLEPGSTVVRETSASKGFTAPPILSALLDQYDRQLTDVAKNPDKYEAGLDAPDSLALLRELAQVGSEIRDMMKEAGLSDSLFKANRIQVVSTTTSIRVPLELFYDGKAPEPDATLCDNWKAGLTEGACSSTCPSDQGGKRRICPRRFWGFSRIIERHIESASDRAWNGDFAVREEPDARSDLRVFRASTVAGSDRVIKHSPTGLADLRAKLETSDGVATHHRLAASWADWETAVKEASPSMLMLLPHTAMQGVQPKLEIGGAFKLISNIEEEHIGSAESRPIVVLLGCETDTNPTQFFDIVSRCRRRGAVVVIAFGATIAVKHAVPAASELIDQLTKACGAAEPGTLGDVMLATRRALAAKGWIAALGLAAYGDADWKLVH